MLKSGKFLLLFIGLSVGSVTATDIRIGLFTVSKVESFVFSVTQGEYTLLADGKPITRIGKGNMLHIGLEGQSLSVSDTGSSVGLFSSLEFIPVNDDGIFQAKPVIPAIKPKEADGKLSISVKNGTISMVNTLDLEKYIPGTVESEGGSGALPEYYKAQAVLARTYAIRNFFRHAHDGFNLCDDVHCQAYNGKSRMNREIYLAVKSTASQILTDSTGQPVITAYHSNCGGRTGSSEIEWNKSLSYLQPVFDPFCDQSTLRNWKKTITKSQWLDYLAGKGYNGNLANTLFGETGRRKYLIPEQSFLPLTDIRHDFALKSAWFHVELSDNSVVFAGHGFGHGLGMCQQGAMEMARKGYCYVDILMFYFKGVQLTRQPQ